MNKSASFKLKYFGILLLLSVVCAVLRNQGPQIVSDGYIVQDEKPIDSSETILIYSLLVGENIGTRYNLSKIAGNRERYAQRHPNHTHFFQRRKSVHVSHPVWQKVEDAVLLVRKFDWIWFLDSTDAFIMNGNISVHSIINQVRKMNPGKQIDIIIAQDCTMINCGSFLLSGSKWTQYMTLYWQALGRIEQKYGGFQDAIFREQDALNYIIQTDFMNARDHTAFVPQRMINAYAENPCGPLYEPGDFIIHEPNKGDQRLLEYMKQKNYVEF
jgi:hypothetical protein